MPGVGGKTSHVVEIRNTYQMNECHKRARMLLGWVLGLGISQEITNYLGWFLPLPNGLRDCTTSREPWAALEREGPAWRPSAFCF